MTACCDIDPWVFGHTQAACPATLVPPNEVRRRRRELRAFARDAAQAGRPIIPDADTTELRYLTWRLGPAEPLAEYLPKPPPGGWRMCVRWPACAPSQPCSSNACRMTADLQEAAHAQPA